jgi:C4-dicarboxylate-specific signal transduction histidine kinase
MLLMCSSFGQLILITFLFNADACLDDEAEARCVNTHLRVAQTHANSIADNFWVDRSKAEKLTILQDRISQAGALAETSRVALAIAHQAMFPLNDQPDILPALLSRFENGEAIYRFVR